MQADPGLDPAPPPRGRAGAHRPPLPATAAPRPGLPALRRDPAPRRAALAAGRGRGGERGLVRGEPPPPQSARPHLGARTLPPPRPPAAAARHPRAPGAASAERGGGPPCGPGPGAERARLPAALTSSMLYFQMVIMAGTVMLAYYFEYTDTFTVNVQGFFCHDSAYRKPYPGPEDSSAVPPVLLYSLAAGVPVLVIIVGETAVFCLQLATRDFENQEKTILTGDCCYINPLVRRTVRFLGIYTFGLFATDIFVNAGQVVTGNLAPHFLALCKPNYTALGCQQYTQFIRGEEACTGNPDLVLRARKTFPSKEAALSVYAAMYLAMYITNTIKTKGTRLAKPVLCLSLMCLAFLTGLNRVAEYRNHWSDVIAGFLVGISIAVFLVVCVVNNFKGRQPENEHIHMDNLAQMPMISIPRAESPLEKVTSVQVIPNLSSKM
ncbi:phospholipid phosphatase-related protein type 5 [Tenrec ecaudatus]|uniref:phospholipid phosphatase-related protein type 5 n=1 Tax=Tenrec ecaudatus TaxID=94439 RepID=UPI003F5A1F8A